MANTSNIREGMAVYSTDDQFIGNVEQVERNAIHVGGRHIDQAQISRVTGDRVYLSGVYSELTGGMAATGEATLRDQDTVKVPVYEERLTVDKVAGEIGEVTLHKTVESEEVTVPIELRHEEVHVHEREVEARPIDAAAVGEAFQERTIRVPVRGEEAVVDKQAYVAGEVHIHKEQVVEQQEIRDTVRRERVDVDEDYQRARLGFQQSFEERQRLAGSTRTWEQAEPVYRWGFEAGYDERYAGREFDEIEPDLRRSYEQSGRASGGWEELREDIRDAWNRTRR